MSSMLTSMTRPYIETAALFTQVWMRPNSRSAAIPICSTCGRSATSAVTAIARPPWDRISSTACSRSAALRAASTTRAPRAAACFAVTRPIPLDAPVMTIVCSDNGRSGNLMDHLVRESFQDRFQCGERAIRPLRRERLGRGLTDDVQGALRMEDLPFRGAVLVAPEAERDLRVADAQVADKQFRNPRRQCRIYDQRFRRGERHHAQ